MNKKNNGLKILLLVIGLSKLIGCTKPPVPEPQPTPTDSIPETPVTPVKTHDTIYLNWDTAPTFGPHEDTIRNRLLKNPQLRELVIHIHGNGGINCPVNCTAVRPHMWPWARVELAQDIAIDDQGRIRLNGTFEITNGDAPNTDHGQEPGIATDDRLWFEANGIIFVLVNLNKGMAK